MTAAIRLTVALAASSLAMAALAADRPIATAGDRVTTSAASHVPGSRQQAPRAACPSPDGPQPDGAIRCEMCPAAPGTRIQYRPMACTNGKWVEAGPCADGDCAGRTY
jgi:hypothetical protein